LRMAHGVKVDKDEQKSPIFIQFIDCVQQILYQYPYAFEFNKQFLSDILYHGYSCQFGSFLSNNCQDQLEFKIRDKTVSLWSYLNSRKDKYQNIYYQPLSELMKKKKKAIWRDSDPETLKRLLEETLEHNKPKDNTPLKLDSFDLDGVNQLLKQYPDVIRPSYSMKHLRLWDEYFLYYSPLSLPLGVLNQELPFQEDIKEYLLLKKIKELKKEVRSLKEKLPGSSSIMIEESKGERLSKDKDESEVEKPPSQKTSEAKSSQKTSEAKSEKSEKPEEITSGYISNKVSIDGNI